jgi:hypothetical protein
MTLFNDHYKYGIIILLSIILVFVKFPVRSVGVGNNDIGLESLDSVLKLIEALEMSIFDVANIEIVIPVRVGEIIISTTHYGIGSETSEVICE